MKIAIVDDEKNLRLAVGIALKKENFEVMEYSNGKETYDAFLQGQKPDLYILDIMMPVMDGIMFLQKYKSISPEIPAIFLTSRDEEFDKILGLELGADDYLCKPFSIKELVARIHAILRRVEFYKENATKTNQLQENISDQLNIYEQSYTATLNGQPLPLTVTEFRLLNFFIKNKGCVLTRDQLMTAAYPEDTYLNDRAIDCHIKRLRKKIGNTKIETVYGLGYKYTE